MLIVSVFTFFLLIFLLAALTVTVAWMGFLKSRAEGDNAARRDLLAPAGPIEFDENAEEGFEPPGAAFAQATEESELFRNERLSTLNFWDALLARFDFMEILKTRIAQADLDWSVGRVTLAMALAGAIVFLILFRLLGFWPAMAGAVLAALAPYSY